MHDNTFSFHTLNPDIIINGLFDLGIRVDSGLTALNSYENRVYQFQDEDRHRYVVKFYRPERWSMEQISEEHSFTLQLKQGECRLLHRYFLITIHFINIRDSVLLFFRALVDAPLSLIILIKWHRWVVILGVYIISGESSVLWHARILASMSICSYRVIFLNIQR